MTDRTSWAIMGCGVAGLAWLVWCTWHDIDPMGWFR